MTLKVRWMIDALRSTTARNLNIVIKASTLTTKAFYKSKFKRWRSSISTIIEKNRTRTSRYERCTTTLRRSPTTAVKERLLAKYVGWMIMARKLIVNLQTLLSWKKRRPASIKTLLHSNQSILSKEVWIISWTTKQNWPKLWILSRLKAPLWSQCSASRILSVSRCWTWIALSFHTHGIQRSHFVNNFKLKNWTSFRFRCGQRIIRLTIIMNQQVQLHLDELRRSTLQFKLKWAISRIITTLKSVHFRIKAKSKRRLKSFLIRIQIHRPTVATATILK